MTAKSAGTIIVNCKAYKEGVGANAVRLAKICEQVSKEKKVSIAIAVQAADIERVANAVSIPVFAQHVDAVEFGAHTGWTLPESAQEAGAVGSLVNHSELRVPEQMIKQIVARLRKLGMVSVVCAANPAEEERLAAFKPDMLAVEPPQLIGGKISVSEAQPEVISQSVKRGKGIPVLVGAGIHTAEDVATAKKLGAAGVLVASGVVLARDQKKALLGLVSGLK